MSGSLDVILEPRLGPRKSARRQIEFTGSDAVVWFDVRDRLTGALVPGATGVAALYRAPVAEGQEALDQPLVPEEAIPGSWRVVVPGPFPGAYTVWLGIEAPVRKRAWITYQVGATGDIAVTSSGTLPWGDVQAAGAAAGASAGLGVVQGRIDNLLVTGLSATLSLPAGRQLVTTADLDVLVTIPAALIVPEHIGRMWTFLQVGGGIIRFVRGDGKPVFSRLGHNATAGRGAAAALQVVWDNIGGVTVHLSGDTASLA